MAIDLKSEQIISLANAARELASIRKNQPFAAATVWGWTKHGVKAGEQIVKLEFTKFKGRLVTSREAVQRFLEACVTARLKKSKVVEQNETVG